MRIFTKALLCCAMAFGSAQQIYGERPMGSDVQGISAFSMGLPKDSIMCHIYGTVINRPESTSAMIVEADKDFRIHDYITVPIVEGRFSYTIHDTIPKAYDVIFNDEWEQGGWRVRNFFSGNGDVELFYYDEDNADDDHLKSNLKDNILAERFSVMKKTEIQDKTQT